MLAFLGQHHLLGFAAEVARTALWLLLISLIFLPVERLLANRPRKILSRATLSDVGFYFIGGLVPGLVLAPLLAVAAVGAHALVPDSVHAQIASWPLMARAAGALFVSEIGFYWGHRWAHEIPLLWRFHAVHHKPEHVYHLISARAHPLDNVFIRLCGFVPVTILGLATPLTPAGGAVSAILVLVLTVWGFLIHADVRWRFGPLEWVVALPAFHHWHHTYAAPKDRNYASMLPVMDWIFGTLHLPRDAWPTQYGTDTPMPRSLVGQLAHPFIGGSGEIRMPEPKAAEASG